MEFFADNWPVIIVVLGVLLVVMGVLRRLVKLAFIGAVIGVLALVVWPMVAT
ncbi:MAG: hypothetical protein AAFN30_04425 [Actinomycetota bacterium]